jgi:two-component system invasion response regulator UvrY
MIRLLLIEDHAILRESLAQMLSNGNIKVVAHCASAFEAMKIIDQGPLDCVLADLSLPDRDGIELIKAIRAKKSGLPVLVLSMYPEEQFAIRALKAGASGYLNKSSPVSMLTEAINQVCQGKKYITPAVAAVLANDLDSFREEGGHESLSDREHQYMMWVAAGLTLTEISEKMRVSPKTVSVYRARTLDKMKLPTTAALVSYAIKNGLTN